MVRLAPLLAPQAAAVRRQSPGQGDHNMADSDQKPVMEPFPDKTGTGWHVIIRYHEGHERRIEGFSTEAEAMEWIVENSAEVEK
jgi:hypothetical protein